MLLHHVVNTKALSREVSRVTRGDVDKRENKWRKAQKVKRNEGERNLAESGYRVAIKCHERSISRFGLCRSNSPTLVSIHLSELRLSWKEIRLAGPIRSGVNEPPLSTAPTAKANIPPRHRYPSKFSLLLLSNLSSSSTPQTARRYKIME